MIDKEVLRERLKNLRCVQAGWAFSVPEDGREQWLDMVIRAVVTADEDSERNRKMANVDFPVRIILPEGQALKLAPNGAEVLATVCDKCFALVPLRKINDHEEAAHS